MKRTIAFFLTFIMLFTAIPQTVHATNNTPTMTMDGYTYKIDTENQTATIVKYTGDATALTVPDSFDGYPVTAISREAFSKCQSLETVILPDSVEDIGYRAFAECSNLRSINFPFNWTKTSGLGERGYVFSKCPSLNSMTVPEGVVSIPARAFAGSSITDFTLPDSLGLIGDHAFNACTGLTSIHIPDSVTKIGSNAFFGCESLVHLQLPEGLLFIGKEAFSKCTSLETVVLPDSVEDIGYKAFAECSNLRLINFPLNWTKTSGLGEYGYAFYKCPNLNSIVVPEGVTKIPSQAFAASSITDFTLPDTLEIIHSSAFSGCSALSRITIPESVTAINHNAFQNCDSLTEIALPKSLVALKDSAFSNCDRLELVYIPSSAEVYQNAFENCPNLRYVTIADKACSFQPNVFKGSKQVTLICPLNSLATVYAIDNNIAFSSEESAPDTDDEVLDRSKSFYRASANSIYTNGFITFQLKYALSDGIWDTINTPWIILKVPAGTTLDESTILVDDVLCTDYKYDESKGTITIRPKQPSGNIKFSSKAYEQQNLQSYTLLQYRRNGETHKDVIGIVNEEMSLLSLYTEEMTSSTQLPVEGIAPAGGTVEIYVNDKLQKTVTANKAGSYQADIALDTKSAFDVFQVEAKSTSPDGEALSVAQTVIYKQDAPTLQDFHFYFTEKSEKYYDLYEMNKEGIRPNITIGRLTDPMKFTVKMDNPDAIETLYVTSTRNNIKKSIEAKYDAATGLFVAVGYFDELNHGYVPGTFGVEYTLKRDSATLSADTFSMEQLKNCLSEEFTNQAEIDSENLESGIKAAFSLGDLSLDIFLQGYDLETDSDLASSIGVGNTLSSVYSYLVPGGDGREFLLSLDYSDPNSWVMAVADISSTATNVGNSFIELHFTTGYYDAIQQGIQPKLDSNLPYIATSLSGYSYALDMISSYMHIVNDYNQLCKDIEMSGLYAGDPEKKQEALDKAKELKEDQMMLILLTTVLPAIATGGTSTAATVAFTALVGAMASLSDIFYAQRIAEIKGGTFRVNWCIDPSGYVYDSVTEERLEGVTTTVYCIEYDESDTFWDNKPAADTYGTMWNAAEYSQQNPLITDAEGRYAWDVPEGWWRVKYEKEGYETIWSEWLPVPPPQTEVNIGMTPLEMPGTPKPSAEPVATAEPDAEPVVTAEPESTPAAPENTDADQSSVPGKAANRGVQTKHH